MTAEAELRAYLLGQLAEDDQQRVEARVFAGEDTPEELLAIEEEVIDEYVRGEMSGPDRASFESYFLTSERRVKKVSSARALAGALDTFVGAEAASTPAFRRSWPPRVAAAAAGLALVAVGWLTLRTARGPIEPAQPADPAAGADNRTAVPDAVSRPATPPGSSAASPPAQSAISLLLVPGSSRDITGGTRLVVPATAEVVLVDVRFEPADYPRFSAVLRTASGRAVWSGDNLRSAGIGEQMSIRLSWPARNVAADDYLLTVTGITPAGRHEDIADYYFRVTRAGR